MDKPEIFRIVFVQKLVPLIGAAFLGALLFAAPATGGWGQTEWGIAGTLAAAALAAYLGDVWRKAAIVLDDTGVRIYVGSARQTWPYEKLLKVKQIGRYRVRMCFDIGRDDGQHRHITTDVWNSDAFTDALLDRYAATQGRELADPEARAA